jgi:malate dehydrogenase
MLPLARYTSIGGVPLTLLMNEKEVEETIQSTRQVAIDVITKKGATVDAPGNAIARMVRAIVWDRKELLPASSLLEGQYGVSGIGIGVPLMLGSSGVERIFELPLNDGERAQFMKGVETIREGVAALPPF